MAQNLDIQRRRLTRLVQHVALNKSGWWDRALERLTLACAYILDGCTHNTLCILINECTGLQSTSNRLSSTITALIRQGSLIDSGSHIRVAEEIRLTFQEHEKQTLGSEQAAYDHFRDLAQEHGLQDWVEELWTIFEEDIIFPLIEQMGARTYDFLNPSSLEDAQHIVSRIDALTQLYGDDVKVFFGAFVDPQHDAVRAFVLRRLNAHYVLNAGALQTDELDHLSTLTANPSRINVFLDTNVLLSVLGLRDHPSNDVAIDLLDLVDQVRQRVNIKLYVLPITVDETRAVIRSHVTWLNQFGSSPRIAEIAITSTSSDLLQRYYQATQDSLGVTPEEYFDPYDRGLIPMLRSKSVEYFNVDLSELREDQDVIDDIHDQADYQTQHRLKGAKQYAANLHDMVLWHFTNRHRAKVAPIDLPLEVPSWIVTLDNGLIQFDKYKQSRQNLGLPLCLHPTSLIHLFQFWVPSSTRLDQALVGSLRQPLLFLDFDIASEQVTLRILAQLSQYINAEHLHPDVATEILANSALRARIEQSPPDRENDERIVREQLPELIGDLGETVADLRRQLSEKEGVVNELERRVVKAESDLCKRQKTEEEFRSEQKARIRAEDKAKQTFTDMEVLVARVASLEETNRQNEQILKEQEDSEVRRWENRRFGAGVFLTLLAMAAVLFVGGITPDEWLPNRPRNTILLTLLLLTLLVGIKTAIRGTRFENTKYVRRLAALKEKTWWTLIVVGLVIEIAAGLILWAFGITLP